MHDDARGLIATMGSLRFLSAFAFGAVLAALITLIGTSDLEKLRSLFLA
jgi:hypothetical protein